MHDEELHSRQGTAPTRPRTRRVLTVRMLVAKTAWLEGTLRWREAGVSWEMGEARLTPTARDLSEAQRSLYQLRRYPVSATLALGDVEGWLERRAERLELAKCLARLPGGNLEILAQQARAGRAPAVETLVSLLAAEALCTNRLPLSPAAVLAGCREAADPPLRGFLRSSELPGVARALAALVLGAVHAVLAERPRLELGDLPHGDWLERAYWLGLQSGLPEEPALVAALLREEEGVSRSRRWAAATGRDQPFALEAELLREQLAAGVPPRRVVALAEAVAEARLIAERLLEHRDFLPAPWERGRHRVAKEYDAEAARSIELFRLAYEQYARAGADPAAIRLATQLMLLLLDRVAVRDSIVPALLEVLEQSLRLPVHRLEEWFNLLLTHHELFWPTSLPPELASQIALLQVPGATSIRVLPALKIARETGDFRIPVAALEQGVLHQFSYLGRLRDPESCWYLLQLMRELETTDQVIYPLGQLLENDPDPGAARRAYAPLVEASRHFSVETRARVLDAAFRHLPEGARQRLEAVPRMARCLTALQPHLPRPVGRLIPALLEAAGMLVTREPEGGVERFERLAALVHELSERDPVRFEQVYDLATPVLLALALAPGDVEGFTAIIRTALQHPPREWWYTLEDGLKSLEQSPELRLVLARAFHRQPHRCTALISRLSAVARLNGPPLQDRVDPSEETDGVLGSQEWAELLRAAPDLEPLAQVYVDAQRTLGGSTAPPRSVAKALGFRARLETELRYLEARIAGGAAALEVRAENLRARLMDEAGLARTIAQEVREHLTDACADAGLAAAERRLQERFRRQLDQFAGPLPEGLQLTDDWLNAALLSLSIDKNRKLLRRLLRECLAGNPRWMEQHPENERYLRTLAERGVDVAAWLGAHPRRYPCAAVRGGWVRVYLERDPLRVLQMGNYFDTCLSFNGANSFSTVANAAELNKRVIYAEDSTGRVIGRQLIAIGEDGKLLGFNTYTSLPENEGAAALRAVICHYALSFAARCGLETADSGTVPRLFAGGWYNDGTHPWTYEGPESRALRQDKRGVSERYQPSSPAGPEGPAYSTERP